ncbi:MAG: 16S rRNA (adenine(1518)-N(6)/adenine(1519)-N(6))-dimethyltransferase [Williamsoniiplasma luminosum]|uniref:Ribosomal RNA small subunit methyltransferase A n=1 Tax=Williamsoniiplasma luminosum TaxID=214888 RepID=A0A2S0NKN9_9MOLU|nr:16S rRNA (adenine(1518)-N(6)/adenine(1519)-N(6))-dimethyltransferase RsmA [Williamsoniiplasma luminosum]AVP49565.1 MAG: 16S rRNA (adenine(1518)-N(6)/adenine(1519)-N(6))-dimethyltransferase [Williamsoniiplasma luminosum]
MEIQAKKKFGQNFISDPTLIKKIVTLIPENKNSLIIEIGPGTGALTKLLVQKFDKVVAIEIDESLIPILHRDLNSENFKIINQDVLTIDFKSLIENEKQNPEQDVYLISNMPYYITSEILFRTFDVSDQIKKAIFMVQKEVATRLIAKESENNYNNLSVAADFYADKKYEFTVLKNKFKPVPKVDSAIVSLTFWDKYKKELNGNDQEFISFVRKIFNNRRKTILNNLTNITNNKDLSKAILGQTKIAENLRPENISTNQYIQLFKNLKVQ